MGPVLPGDDGKDISSPDPGLFSISGWGGGMASPGPDSVPSEGRGWSMASSVQGPVPPGARVGHIISRSRSFYHQGAGMEACHLRLHVFCSWGRGWGMKSLVPGPVPPGSDGWDMSFPDPGLFAIRD